MSMSTPPSVVLLCQHDEAIDREGLAAWIATSMRLAGVIVIHDDGHKRWRALRAEYRRSGWIGLADVLAFRLLYAARQAASDRRWIAGAIAHVTSAYTANRTAVPRLDVTDPNSDEARRFLERCQPDLAIARCRHLLKPGIFNVPRHGTFVLHPGICPEYRNAHGCFWALARRDLTRVGMTLLRVDAGIDTGAVYLHASYPFDERQESHRVIQYRVVLENLDLIARTLTEIVQGRCGPLSTAGRPSAVWGQPRLSTYCTWRRHARRALYEAPDIAPSA